MKTDMQRHEIIDTALRYATHTWHAQPELLTSGYLPFRKRLED